MPLLLSETLPRSTDSSKVSSDGSEPKLDPAKASLVTNWLNQQRQQPPDARIDPLYQQPQQSLGQQLDDPPSESSEILSMPSPEQDGEELTPEESDMLNDHFQGTLRGGGNVCSVACRRRRRQPRNDLGTTGMGWGRGRLIGGGDNWDLEFEGEKDDCSMLPASSDDHPIATVHHTLQPHSHSTFKAAAMYTQSYSPSVILVTTNIRVESSSARSSPSQAGKSGVWTDIWAGNKQGNAPCRHKGRL